MSDPETNQPLCYHCSSHRYEPLVRACGCGPDRVIHYTCLRNRIIATADKKCESCHKWLKDPRGRIKRMRGPKIYRNISSVVIFWTVFFVIWMLSRQMSALYYRLQSARHRSQRSWTLRRADCPYNEFDLCIECRWALIGINSSTADVHWIDLWLPFLLQWFFTAIVSASVVKYIEKKFARPDDHYTKILLLKGFLDQVGVRYRPLKLYVSGNWVDVEVLPGPEIIP